MTIEKANHIEEQKFRSVREAGYAEEDVDMYITAFTASYNRLIDAKYEAELAAEQSNQRAAEIEEQHRILDEYVTNLQKENFDLNANIIELTNQNEILTADLNAAQEALQAAQTEAQNAATTTEEPAAEAEPTALTIDYAADQAASLLRRAEEIAKEHIHGAEQNAATILTKAEEEADSIVGTAKREIAFLEATKLELTEEKDLILSRLRDFFSYEVSHVDELIDTYENIEFPTPAPEETPEENEALVEAEQAYFADREVSYINDTNFSAPHEEEIVPEMIHGKATYEENYAPIVEETPSTPIENYAPPTETTPNVATSPTDAPTVFDEILAPTYNPIAATAATGSTELPAAEEKPTKTKRSFRDALNGRKK